MPCHPLSPVVDLLGFLVLGLLGSVGHCVGMCSPFVLFVSRRYSSAGRAAFAAAASAPEEAGPAVLVPQLWYHAGRVATYAMLGALAGGLGHVLQAAGAFVGLQRTALLVAGGVLVTWALMQLSDPGWFPRTIRLKPDPTKRMFGRVAGALKGRVPSHPFAVGLLLGLLPCGLLYSALVAGVARGGALQGALALALFGLGTAPALLGVSLADALIARRRVLLNRLAQAFVLAMGGWFLWRGLTG